jgi:heat shock protein 1/8
MYKIKTLQVNKMVTEAEKFAKEDKEKRDAIDTKNQADSVLYQTEKQLKELGDKVLGPVKEKVEAKVKELKNAISSGSTQAIKDAMTALNQEVMQLGQSIYSQPSPANQVLGLLLALQLGHLDQLGKQLMGMM